MSMAAVIEKSSKENPKHKMVEILVLQGFKVKL
jgi:hypothetical protein